VFSGTLYFGSIMPRYVRADVQNRCLTYQHLVIKRARIQADKSMSDVSAFGASWPILIHSRPVVMVSLASLHQHSRVQSAVVQKLVGERMPMGSLSTAKEIH